MSDLLFEISAGIARITLNRPQRRNALSFSLLRELEGVQSRLREDASARVVVLAGAGPVFSSGHDLSEMVGRPEKEYRELFELCSRVMLGLRRLPQPVIARVHGPAFAAGCQLVAACDLAVAAEEATFATPGVKIGLFCTTPAVPLVRAVPAKPAMEMLLTGQPVSAKQALAWGLVNRVVPAAGLDEAVMSLARPIMDASPLTVRMGKEAFYRQQGMTEEEAYEMASDVMTANACKHDAQEGMGAFLQKRAPKWEGR
jgi:enoyl-CoA hydratase/carnithine racemase